MTVLTTDAFGFRSTRDDFEMTANEDSPTLMNPRTHGAFTPRLVGQPSRVTLSSGGRAVNWEALVTARGPISFWGRPIIRLPDEISFQQVDQILKKFIDENANVFGVSSQDLRNDQSRTKYSGPYKYITYQRYFRVEDAPFKVQGAFITFRFKGNRLIQITNYSFGEIGVVEAPTVGADEAIASIMEDAQYDDEKDRISKMSAELQPFFGSDRRIHFRFVYQATVKKTFPKGSFDYSVSALDGHIVRIMSGIHTAQVLGEVYPRLRGESVKTVPMPEIMVVSGSEKAYADAGGNFEGENVTAMMVGQRAAVLVNSKEKVTQPQDRDGNILFSSGKFISENMAYVHVNRVNGFVRNFVKTPAIDPAAPEKNFLDQPIMVSTHTQHPFIKNCNAWFDGRGLNFLSEDAKCFDSAQFADIVYHEWGHALDNALGGIQDNAFSEAIGDITAMLMTGDSKIGPGFLKNQPNPIRDLTTFRHYPEGQDTDPHKEGLIVGGSWYDFYQLMVGHYGLQEGRAKTAEIFFKHLISTDAYTDSYQGALIVDDDDGNLENCTPHMCLMNAAFAKHGLASADPRCQGNEIEGKPACGASTIFP